MKPVLEWVKTNVFTVVFLVVMIAALVALPFVAGSMNESVQETASARKRLYNDLNGLEKTSVVVPSMGGGAPVSQTILVNKKFLDRYKAVTEEQSEDARRVLELAADHNRKGRGVLIENLFPERPLALRETLPFDFYNRLVDAYESLLERIGAGSPPDVDELTTAITERRVQFLQQELGKNEGDALSEEEEARLAAELTRERLSRYALAAEEISLYVDTDVLGVPVWDFNRPWTQTELFGWQWDYWIISDILLALADANTQPSGARLQVPTAPVKRVVSITIDQLPQGGGPRGSRGGLSAGGGGGDMPSGVRPNPQQEVQPDYSVSFTGRYTNALYDVRNVWLELVVDTTSIPVVMDALARYNFMTVLDVTMTPADQYQDIAGGFYYGSDPVSRLSIKLETIWLRNWTTSFMPDELRLALNIAPDSPAPSGDG